MFSLRAVFVCESGTAMDKYYLFYLIIIIILCVVLTSLCNESGNDIVCQSFDGRTNSIEQYCEQYQGGLLPPYCGYDGLLRIDAPLVKNLITGGCDPNVVLHSMKKFENVHTLDISHSGYATLNWLCNITLMHLHRYNASHNALTYVYQLLTITTPEVNELDLSFNRLSNIGSRTFGVIKKLKNIYLSNNQLTYISFDAFIESEQLAFIDLRMNRFHEIPPIYENEHQIQTILLHDNPINRFNYCLLFMLRHTSVLISWKNVELFWRSQECRGKHMKPLNVVLDSGYEGILFTSNGNCQLHCNEHSFEHIKNFSTGHTESFTNIVDVLYAFDSSIMHLDLTGNRVEKFPDTTIFGQFDRLATLTLSNTQLTDFDLGTFKTPLTKIDLSHNRLTRIENARLAEQYLQLITFNVAGNRIENLQDVLQYMSPTIKWIDLTGNYVGPLNENIFNRLSSLRMLNLKNTMLSNINDLTAFKMLVNLNVLNLSHNNLKNVNFSTLKNLSMLNDFYVAYCQIDDISRVTQYLGKSVRKLDLSGNYISSLGAQSIKTLTYLEYLNLSHAQIINIDSTTFQYQLGLTVLDLSHNNLQTIDLRLLSHNVEKLHLNDNNLETIENFKQTNHFRLKLLAIEQNQLSCLFLREFMTHWKQFEFLDDPLEQKHGDQCRSSTQGVKDFMSSIYDTIKFW